MIALRFRHMRARPRDVFKSFAPLVWDALRRFERDDGWAIASHVALSGLLAIFPFLIFVTALAAFLGAGEASGNVVRLIFDTWPSGVAMPLATEVQKVLTTPRGGVLTIGVLLTLWVSSSAVESLRIALGRAYQSPTSKPFWLSRLQSIWFVMLGAFGLITVAVLIVLWPILWKLAFDYTLAYFPEYTAPFVSLEFASNVARYAITILVVAAGLTATHLWLPGGRRRVRDVLPGVAVTVALWIAGATAFSIYLARFANYASTYAGLAGIMTAIVFLNVCAALFILGAEFNAALAARRKARIDGARATTDAAPVAPIGPAARPAGL
ncbi:YihY/virulence factor BrkB family protein [Methylopila henanensis]|uniref:YihY/virulence factor BrkB family protein n=1 Tax=Methylopila henanensis TaxID=873516 RepID=A0ABW4K982_9HYPH